LKFFLPLAVGGGLAAGVLQRFSVLGLDGAPTVLDHAAVVLDPVPALSQAFSASAFHGAWLLVALTIAWAGAALCLLARTARDLRAAGRHGGRPLAAACLSTIDRKKLAKALTNSGVALRHILVSEAAVSPAAVGILRPRILLPRDVIHVLSAAELRAVLVHEDMHRRRRDPLLLFAQRIAAALFFFHPLLRPLLRSLREAQEIACDEGALRVGVRADDLSRALARTLRLRLGPLALSTAVGDQDSSLLRRRFARLSVPGRVSVMRRYRALVLVAFAIVAVGTFLPLADGAVAQKSDDPDSEVAKFPVPIHQVQPEYPEKARKAGIEGEALIRVLVNEKGRVKRAKVKRVNPKDHPEFGVAAAIAARLWTFMPGLDKDGEPIAVEVLIPFRFALDDDKKAEEKRE
jgi:TonB family protein